MHDKNELHRLIDELSEQLAGEVLDFVQFLRQKESRRAIAAGMSLLQAAPVDDEPDTEVEREDSRQAREEYRREGGVRLEDLRAELGI